MVRKGTRLLESVSVGISTIEELRTPQPTVSNKDSPDVGQKLRYLIDQAEAILAQTDLKLSQFRDALRGAGNKDLTTLETDIESILGRLNVNLDTRAPKDEGETVTIASAADISGGVTAALKNYKRWTLYLKTAGAIDITVELSPDGGTTWFTIPEAPISFSASGDDVIEFGYDATNIRLTGSTTVAVTAIVRGVF